MNDAGTIIRDRRQRSALYLHELAERCKVSKPMLSLVETGQVRLSDKAARRVAAALGLDGRDLMARFWLQRIPADVLPALRKLMDEGGAA